MDTAENNTNNFEYKKSLKDEKRSLWSKILKVDKYVNRPTASLLVRAVFNTRITPNQLTYFSLLLGLLGAYFFTRGDYLFVVLGGVMIQLSSLVDSADGMLARAKNMCSDYGAYLDLFFDRIIDFVMFITIGIGLYRSSHKTSMLVLGILIAGLYLLQLNLYYLSRSFLKIPDKGGASGEARAILMWLVTIFSIANRMDILLYMMLVETLGNILFRTIGFMSLGRKKTDIDPQDGSILDF